MNPRNIFSELSSEIEERTRTGGLAGGGLGDGGNGGGLGDGGNEGGLGDGGNGGGLSSCIAEGIHN